MSMVKGIGVDTTALSEIRQACGDIDVADNELNAFARRTFTQAERDQARTRHDPIQYLAGRFAVKEAVFKALAQHTQDGFDLRIVESLDDENGCPHVSVDGALRPYMEEAAVTEILVSITNEGDFATAFVVAQ